MQLPSRSPSSQWLIRFAVLLLGLSVFNCGLQARLAAGNPHTSGVRQSVKLSTERSFGTVGDLYDLALERFTPAHLHGAPWLALLFHGRKVQPPEPRQVELSLWVPQRYDSFGAFRLQLPPPAHA